MITYYNRIRTPSGSISMPIWPIKKVHAEQTSKEIEHEFEKVDWIFIGTGTTGTIGGISERLRLTFPKIKLSPSNRKVRRPSLLIFGKVRRSGSDMPPMVPVVPT